MKKNKKTVEKEDDKKIKRKRGKEKDYTDKQLMDLAFDIKHRILKGAKLSYLAIEKHTGISRNTFKRRIPDYIEQLNTPITRKIELTERDDIYFPSFEVLFQKYGHDYNLLKDALYEMEQTFYDIYKELEQTRNKLEETKKSSDSIESLKKEIADAKKQAKEYKTLYHKHVVSSTFEHKRQELGLESSIIEFKSSKENIDLTDLSTHFETSDGKGMAVAEANDSKEKAQSFMNSFSNLSNLFSEE